MNTYSKLQRKIDRVAVAQSLRELEILFVKKPPDGKAKARLQPGLSEAGKTIGGATCKR